LKSNHFSFEDLEVWQKSIEFADEVIQIVDELNQRISLGLPRGGSLRTCGLGGALLSVLCLSAEAEHRQARD